MSQLTDDGGLYILNCLFGSAAPPSEIEIRLCTAALQMVDAADVEFQTVDGIPFFARTTEPTDMVGRITISEVNGAGYAPVRVPAGMSAVNLNALDIPKVEWDEQEFTFSSSLNGTMTIYGYQLAAIADGVTELVLFEGLIPTPYTAPVDGGSLKLTPQIRFGNGTPT